MSDSAGSQPPGITWERGGMRRKTSQKTSPVTNAAVSGLAGTVARLRRRKVLADTIIYAGLLQLELLSDDKLLEACSAVEGGRYVVPGE